MEIKCVKNGWVIRFEIPTGEDPIPYAKNRLKELSGKTAYKWEYEVVK